MTLSESKGAHDTRSHRSSFLHEWQQRLTLPVIAAPMTGVSGPDLVAAACRSGVIGAFPTQNTPSVEALDAWLEDLGQRLSVIGNSDPPPAPFAVNIVMRRDPGWVREEVAVITARRVEAVITSVGSPAPVVEALRRASCRVFADVATEHHARRALEAKVDGLVLLASGAGGQTGWMNPIVFARAVREFFDGPMVLAGGVADGASVWASEILGYDLAYVGTGFIVADESLASDLYKDTVVAAGLDDIENQMQSNGLPVNVIRPRTDGVPRFTAGQSAALVSQRAPVAHIVERLRSEYLSARVATRRALERLE